MLSDWLQSNKTQFEFQWNQSVNRIKSAELSTDQHLLGSNSPVDKTNRVCTNVQV